MAKSNKKAQAETKRLMEINAQPTIYTFNFKDIPLEKYGERMDLLFHDPDFSEMVEKRNALVKMAGRVRPNSPEMQNLIRTIQQRDRKLADLMYAAVVQINLRSDVTYDFLSFATLLKYYVDYSKPGMQEKADQLSANLDKITFLSDMLESVLTDVKAEMNELFGNSIDFNQFDGVAKVLQQLRGFFKSARDCHDANSKEAQLYFDYADSINEYLEKRLKTYSEKYLKLKPRQPTHTEKEMIEAINLFFESEHKYDSHYIKHTESGGSYIDAIALAYNLTPSETDRLDKVMEAAKSKVTADKDPLNYCFNVTDAIMLYYRMNHKQNK